MIAQNGKYIPFPSQMITYTYAARGNSEAGWYSVSRFEIGKDTLINGFHYSKYFLAESNKNGIFSPFAKLEELTKLVGAIRNDTPAKKVYLYTFDTNAETLLYDFDLHLGDTLFKNDGYRFYKSLLGDEIFPTIDTVWVSSIDSILMAHDGLYHKRFNFKTWFRPYNKSYLISSDTVYYNNLEGVKIRINSLVEGVGTDYAPVTTFNEFEHNWDYFLYCRSIDGKTVNNPNKNAPPFMSTIYCDPIVTGIDKEEKINSVKLYPNPSMGRFSLTTLNSESKSFEIINLLGVKIFNSTIEKDLTEIDLSAYPSGIYFICVYNKYGQSVTKKIMIE